MEGQIYRNKYPFDRGIDPIVKSVMNHIDIVLVVPKRKIFLPHQNDIFFCKISTQEMEEKAIVPQ